MNTAFQTNAFQNDAFQIAVVVTPPGGGASKGGRPSRMQVLPEPEPVDPEDWITLI